MENLDSVVVVGAGPAGLVTALRLARSGVPVTIFEAEAQVIDSPRAVAYYPPTSAALDRLGVLQDVLKQGLISRATAYRRADGSVLGTTDMSLMDGHTPYPYVLLLGQNSIAEILVRHLKQMPHVEFRWGHRVTGVEQDADSVFIDYIDASGTGRVRAPWVAAADGARSPVRESLGLSFHGITWPERFVATNVFYDFTLHGFTRSNFVLDPVDWAIIVQIDKTGLWRVCYGEDPDIGEAEVLARQPMRFERMLPGHPGPSSYRVDMCTPYRVHQRTASAFRKGRVLLAGDAAHATNPIGGLGLSTGIIDADQLGAALAAVWSGESPESCLDEYAEIRRRVFLEFSSPAATENKRRLMEADPARRAQDAAALANLDANRDQMRDLLLRSSRLTGDWVREAR